MMTSGSAAFPYAPFGLIGLALGWVVDLIWHTGIEPVAEMFYSLGTLTIAAVTAWLALLPRPKHPTFSAALALSTAILVAAEFPHWYILWAVTRFAITGRWYGWASSWQRHLGTLLI